LTKKQLEEKMKIQRELMIQQDSLIAKQAKEIDFLKKLLADDGVVAVENKDFVAPEDGTLSCGDLTMLVKKGYTEVEMEALMEIGKKMIEWCAKHHIRLDGDGSGESN
tara:strand:+ start:1059 stop:1382 length:324 start_codon:yes stop_codon:yes gene_type:complete